MSHGDIARAREYEAFALSRRAAEDPAALAELQRYYATAFLPDASGARVAPAS